MHIHVPVGVTLYLLLLLYIIILCFVSSAQVLLRKSKKIFELNVYAWLIQIDSI